MNNKPNYAEIVMEDLLNQITFLTKEVSLLRADIKMLQFENEELKQNQKDSE